MIPSSEKLAGAPPLDCRRLQDPAPQGRTGGEGAMLLGKIFNFMIRDGAIRVVDAAGRTRTYGDGSAPRCTMRLHSRLLDYMLPFNPSLYFSEAYMEGLITFDEGTLADFLEVSIKNYIHLEQHPL